MVLENKNTVVAFRCPTCGKAVRAQMNIFRLSAAMLRLRCPDCGEGMTVKKTNDGKLRLTVPCLVCAHPHNLTISEQTFFCDGLFTVPCALSGLDILFLGDEQKVDEALKKSGEELERLLEEAGIENFAAFRRKDEDRPDPAVENVVRCLLCELEDEGKITCFCKDEGETPLYDFQILSERVRIFCRCCNAEAVLPLRSEADAEDFIRTDRIDLH